MKVLCVGKLRTEYHWSVATKWLCDNLTINKWYDIIKEENSSYIVFDDKGITRSFYKHDNLFITHKEYRKLKLKKINDSRTN